MIEYDNRSWLKLLFSLKGSVIPRLLPRIAGFAALGAAVAYGYLRWHPGWSIDASPWTIVGMALGLLLVFRTNTAYDRYWEGRKMWGGVVTGSRKLAMDVVAYIRADSPEARVLKRKLIRYGIAFPVLMKQRLRDEQDLSEIQGLMEAAEFEVLRGAPSPPVLLLTLIEKALYRCYALGVLDAPHLPIFDRSVRELLASLGACERIRTTPMPVAYVLHLKRFLVLFCATLPLGLVGRFGWWTPLIVFFISYAMLGIEEIGVEIEDPFGDDPNDLPLEQITAGIGRVLGNLAELAEDSAGRETPGGTVPQTLREKVARGVAAGEKVGGRA